ncbi:spore coat protein [Paenibacillus jiagnxiensis]|uniref:spore coat protein n=1 Tax=Paenibacillus jiagnxiensis TaxID=3228926 RepID=UPI0033A1D015
MSNDSTNDTSRSAGGFGVHEKLELHELLVFKTGCLTKSQMMLPQVQEDDLKSILLTDIQYGMEDVKQLKEAFEQKDGGIQKDEGAQNDKNKG